MKTIHKYPLILSGEAQTIALPGESRLLTVADQHGCPTLWFEVDTDGPVALRVFVVVGTGHELPREGNPNYVGTAFCGPFVWHVYEIDP